MNERETLLIELKTKEGGFVFIDKLPELIQNDIEEYREIVNESVFNNIIKRDELIKILLIKESVGE